MTAGDRGLRLPARTALLLVDGQQAIDDPKWTAEWPRNNPQAESNLAALLAAWRHVGYPIIHVRHDSTFPNSPYRPGQPANELKPEARPAPGERIIAKQTNSAFVGTGLEAMLREADIHTLMSMPGLPWLGSTCDSRLSMRVLQL